MKCILCGKKIENYNALFNHLVIDEDHSSDICKECSKKFIDWQGKIMAALFPTKAMKKFSGSK